MGKRVVLDTNIYISALLFGGNPATLVECALHGKIEVVISPPILDEFREKLADKFHYPLEMRERAVAENSGFCPKQ